MDNDLKKRNLMLRKRIAEGLERFVKRNTSHGGDTVEDIAGYIGLTRKELDQRMHGNASSGPTRLAMHEVIQLTRALEDDTLMQHFCQLAGGSFVPGGHDQGAARPAASWKHAMELLMVAVRETGEGLSVSAAALSDQIVTAEEKRQVRTELEEVLAAVGQLLAAIDSMSEQLENVRRISLGDVS